MQFGLRISVACIQLLGYAWPPPSVVGFKFLLLSNVNQFIRADTLAAASVQTTTGRSGSRMGSSVSYICAFVQTHFSSHTCPFPHCSTLHLPLRSAAEPLLSDPLLIPSYEFNVCPHDVTALRIEDSKLFCGLSYICSIPSGSCGCRPTTVRSNA